MVEPLVTGDPDARHESNGVGRRLSLMPAEWFGLLSAAPAWSYCVGSVGL